MPSKLEQLQLQFRQRLIKEKEERMIKIHTDSQQKALSKVAKYDSPAAVPVSSALVGTMTRKLHSMSASPLHQSPTKKGSPGVDRSRPLPPISREQQIQLRNHQQQQPSRSHHSSTSSEASSSSAFPSTLNGGGRARSMDYEAGSKVNGRVSQELAKNAHRPKRSPETNSLAQRQNQRPELSTKTNEDYLTKLKSNCSPETSSNKSSNQQKLVHTSKYQPTQPPAKPAKTRANAVTAPSRKVDSVSRSKTGINAAPVRKPPNANQDQCRYCGRNFNKDRIEKHISICAKSSQKKVKVFDATKMRVQGTEAESFVRRGVHNTPTTSKQAKKSNWKKQHDDFINTIRQAKVAQRHLAAGGKLSDLPPPPPSDTSDYVQCPHCGRRFSEGVAQRHIPKCKNILSNKKSQFKKK